MTGWRAKSAFFDHRRRSRRARVVVQLSGNAHFTAGGRSDYADGVKEMIMTSAKAVKPRKLRRHPACRCRAAI